MSRISKTFQQILSRRGKALIPFLMAGDPDLKTSARILEEVAKAGADMIEIGMPFSDPLADGKVIQDAGFRAMQKHTTPAKVFELTKSLAKKVKAPLILMTYFNLVYRMGYANFAKKAKASGIDGVILSDLPFDEAQRLKPLLDEKGIDLIFLLAPTSTDERIARVTELTGSFIYCVSRRGVTGMQRELEKDLKEFLGRVRRYTTKPLAVGFGISTPQQAQTVAKFADGIIIGSALISKIQGQKTKEAQVRSAVKFIRGMKAVLNKGS